MYVHGLLGGDGRLAQHVVGMAEAQLLAIAGVVERLADGLAGDELLAHQAHGDVDAGADQAARRRARSGAPAPPTGPARCWSRSAARSASSPRSRHSRTATGCGRDGRASRRRRSCRGSGHRACRRRECAAAPRRGTSAPRPPGSTARIRGSAPRRRPTASSPAAPRPAASPARGRAQCAPASASPARSAAAGIRARAGARPP